MKDPKILPSSCIFWLTAQLSKINMAARLFGSSMKTASDSSVRVPNCNEDQILTYTTLEGELLQQSTFS